LAPRGARDIGAMSLVKLASGVNLLGYYLNHRGTNIKGVFSSLQVTKASCSLNDLLEYSYDFRAPIREYGQLSETYREIKFYLCFSTISDPPCAECPRQSRITILRSRSTPPAYGIPSGTERPMIFGFR
jgi:hypothetical protein